MINLVDLFEKNENDIFLSSPHASKNRDETYGQFLNRCERMKFEILALKIREEMIVGFQPDNTVESIAFFFALVSLNLIPALFSRRMPLDAVKAMLGHNLFFEKNQILELSERAEGRRNGTLISISANQNSLKISLTQKLLFWTSGTSSKPKAAVLHLSNFYYNALGSRENISFGQGDRWLLKLPIEHVGGMAVLFRALLGGGTVVLDSSDGELPLGVTHLSFVSTQLHRYLHRPVQTPVGTPSTLKAVLLGGGAIPKDLVDKALDQGLPIFKSYGMTEMASQITTTRPGAKKEDVYTSGWGLPGREIKVEGGHILVKGPCLFDGYVDDLGTLSPSAASSAIWNVTGVGADGWFKTKDLGEWTPHGLRILGRSDRMFISAGENIQPEAIEQSLLEFPGILGAKVVPLDDIEYGKRPLAFIRKEGEINVDQIQSFLKKKLTGLQIPREILNWSEMPEQFKTTKDL